MQRLKLTQELLKQMEDLHNSMDEKIRQVQLARLQTIFNELLDHCDNQKIKKSLTKTFANIIIFCNKQEDVSNEEILIEEFAPCLTEVVNNEIIWDFTKATLDGLCSEDFFGTEIKDDPRK